MLIHKKNPAQKAEVLIQAAIKNTFYPDRPKDKFRELLFEALSEIRSAKEMIERQ